MTTKIRDFGNYTVRIDKEPPVIRALNIFPNKKVKKQSSILVKVSDNLSGIKTYRGTLNGKWILMDYDDVIVHIFYEPVREFYDIERLWSEAPRMEVDENAIELTVLDIGI